jgi:amidase
MQLQEGRPHWSIIANRRRELILSKIPAEWLVGATETAVSSVMHMPETSGIMTAEELAITELLAADLVKAIRDRTYTAMAVTIAFCKRAAIAHHIVRLESPRRLLLADSVQRRTA